MTATPGWSRVEVTVRLRKVILNEERLEKTGLDAFIISKFAKKAYGNCVVQYGLYLHTLLEEFQLQGLNTIFPSTSSSRKWSLFSKF